MQFSTDESVSLLSRLIANRCVNDGTPDSGQEVRNADTIEEYLDGSGVEVTRVEPHPGRVSVIFTVKGEDPDASPLSLLGHTDVVPADPARWSRDPFSGEVADGVVWGRGAIDMLNLTSAMAVVTKRIAERDRPPAADLVFAAVADEEAGSRFGVGWIEQNRPELLPWDNAITESGGAHIPAGHAPTAGPVVTVTVGEKGGLPHRIVVRTASGHASMPYGVDNAAVLIAEAVVRIARHRTPTQLDDSWRTLVRAHGFDERTERALLDARTIDDHLHVFGSASRFAHAVSHLTITPTILHSGEKSNVIPGAGQVDLDIRQLSGQSADDVDRELRVALGDIGDRFDIVHLGSGNPSSSSTDTRLYRSLQNAVDTEFPGATTVPVLTGGGTDARFVRKRGGNAYGFALFEPDWSIGRYRTLFHGEDEHIDINSLMRTTRALGHVVTDFLAPESARSSQQERTSA
ncbi:M20/M25/M40 family metallo-hydrolase [Rhodococcus sp. Eu-32]|uniref:M20/M25/M40 family metallo-hydrolase n=1 Tax=Rhodococcus sp. Eu-32 TaxID=1017319 RepID=UPI000DF3217C|nr:M20/M25/M40 family metallo-hydrolase [Rhodococcus sp. Eu-32]RRQ26575.1 M20/M25/M40 family metallo-hydrolase [Rhodococcus sp. Eu-32]